MNPTNDPRTIRLIQDDAQPGVVNMARDEALLHLVGRGQSPPTLRLYEWSEPTISLGYFQKYADYEQLAAPAGDMPVVRRQTGGGAILHDQELTYSLIVPADYAPIRNKPTRLYEIAHEALITTLEENSVSAELCGTSDDSGPSKGPFFCFARRHALDVVIADEKLAGSAQRRSQQAILQHGSIVVERRYKQQPAAVTGVSINKLRVLLPDEVSKRLNTPIILGQWTDQELSNATDLVSKYAGDEWTRRI